MEVTSLGALNTILRLKLSPFLPHPQAMLYFAHPVHFTHSWKVFVYPNIACRRRGRPLEASELLQRLILCYVLCIFDLLPLFKGRFSIIAVGFLQDFSPPLQQEKRDQQTNSDLDACCMLCSQFRSYNRLELCKEGTFFLKCTADSNILITLCPAAFRF